MRQPIPHEPQAPRIRTHKPHNLPRHNPALTLTPPAEVIHTPGPAARIGEPHAAHVVVDVDPVPDVAAVAVQGQLGAVEGVCDEQGDEFLRVLVGSVCVSAAGDDDVEGVRAVRCEGELFGGCFAGGVGGGGVHGGEFGEGGGGGEGEAAVDFVGGDVDEAADVVGAGGVEEGLRAEDVGEDEVGGGEDGSVDMGFGGEVEYRVDGGGGGVYGGAVRVDATVGIDAMIVVNPTIVKRQIQSSLNILPLAYISMHEAPSRLTMYGNEVLQVPSVSQSVEDDDLVGPALSDGGARKVAADESRAACYEPTHFVVYVFVRKMIVLFFCFFLFVIFPLSVYFPGSMVASDVRRCNIKIFNEEKERGCFLFGVIQHNGTGVG